MFKPKDAVRHTEFELHDTSYSPTTPLQTHAHTHPPPHAPPRMRRDSQFRAVAHTMNKTVSGRFIRTWSAWLLVALAMHIALFVGIAAQDLRKNLYIANAPLAKLNFLVVTTMVFALPFMCQFFLRTLASGLAGLRLGERGYSVAAAGLLLAVNLEARLDLAQFAVLFQSAEKGVKDVVLMCLIGDYVVFAGVPFVSLALLIQSVGTQCWMRYDWAWLLFALLWPIVCSVAVTISMIRFWASQECIRAGPAPGVSSTLQTALDFALILKDADGNVNRLSGRWRYGYQVLRDEGYVSVDQSFLGLVREDECLSLTDMLLALESEDEIFGGKATPQV